MAKARAWLPGSIRGTFGVAAATLLAGMLVFGVMPAAPAAASHGGSVVCDPATGHCYEYLAGPLDWEDAKAAAEALTHNGVAGHLATVTSAAETTFIVNNLPDAVFHHPPFDGGAWIGAFQPAGSSEPGGGWQWVTGEPWDYTTWAGGEPNNSGGVENAVNFWQGAGAWNDVDGSLLKGYLVEYDDVPVVYSSGAHVETWDPIIPATQPDNWPSTICVPTPAVGPDAAWVNPHAAFAFGTSAATFQTHYAQFTAEWINAWDSIASADTADFGGTAPHHNWTKYSTTVTGTGTFDLSLLADNCSWIFLDGILVGFQSTDLSIQTYPVNLFGTHTLEFIVFDGGGQAGGMFLLETSTTAPLDTDGDGLFDFSEVNLHGTDPNNPDTDGDGVSDGDEVLAGTDPLSPPPDTTPPTITPTVTGTLGDNDWYVGDVVVTWAVVEDESDFTTTGCDATTITVDTAGVTLTCEATSVGGTAAESVTLKRDATAPEATASRTPAANANGWNNTDVTVSFSGTDNLSGIASCDADVVLGEGEGQSASGSCTDNAGNVSAPASVVDINVDKTAPVVTVTGTTDGASYLLGDEPTVGCSTTDALSGVDTEATATVSGGPVGTFSVTCGGATDLAGNAASAVAANYTVTYDFCGFKQPLLVPVQVFKTGSTVPVKFCVQDASGNFVPGVQAEVYANGVLQGTAKQTDDGYHFNLKTKGMVKGPLTIEVRLDDGTTHSIEVALK